MRIFQRADSPTSVSFQQYCFKYSNVTIWHLRSNSIQYTGVMAQWLERLPQNRKVVGSSPDLVIPKNGTHCLLFCRSMHENGAGKLSTRSYQWTCPPAAAFTALADMWPMATGNWDRHRPMRHWRARNLHFFWVSSILYKAGPQKPFQMVSTKPLLLEITPRALKDRSLIPF